MQPGTTLDYMYPNESDPPMNYEVVSGKITYWDAEVLGPQPTEQQLQDAWLPALKAQKEAELIRAADAEEKTIWTAEIEFKYVLIRRIMGQTISASQQQKAQAVLAIFTKLETKVGQVRVATTEAEVQVISW